MADNEEEFRSCMLRFGSDDTEGSAGHVRRDDLLGEMLAFGKGEGPLAVNLNAWTAQKDGKSREWATK